MKFTFGLPEMLVLFSFAMYTHSQTLSVVAFVFAVVGRSCSSLMEYASDQDEDKAAEIITSVLSKKQ
tara:strand:- start:65 stop:265 length:201 start_codon:yes stop_codon:yes gene_type:complete